ncbi:MAG TPA: N,N-dimethylformamidase beta subunit family domain-containing protein, partial [Vicinamibacterales bacterium]|nr:N,N-dimethylformamidase beta subunit family domain-containing protein [Vicinamibacterales bacterium]
MAAAALTLQVAGRLTAQATNPIPAENLLTGNPRSEWDITGSGDATIQGFATDISVNKGGTISFKVTTTAALFSMNVYRLGYYQGNGARKVGTITNITGRSQPACITDAATGLYDCGNWTASTSWSVPANAVSGIYIARIARNDTGGASHIPFIVRDDALQADIVLQANDTTWQAYNQYGGHSVYLGTPVRGYKVSYNRPFATRGQSSGYGASNFVFYAEYPMIRWLESNGYNVKYQSGVDTDRFGSSLTGAAGPKVLMTVGHDEYWSDGMRNAVEAARNAGVNIAMFTGNEVFWKTRWETSIDGSNTPYRTLVTYKETHENKVFDPMDPPTWTGTWRDPRFSPPADGGRPETSLTGQLFTVNRGTAAIKVPGVYAPLRFWRNTGVAALAPNQTVTLAADTLGYEWDEDLDNGWRPAGSMQLSETIVNVPEHVQDMGSTYLPGTATHHLSLYRHSSGALVFGAGTVQWVWGLDTNHDTDSDFGSATPDANMRQATLNLLADMGAQPATIQSGLIPATASTDTTAPDSAIASPAPAASIPAGTIVTVSGTATDTGGGVVAAVEVSADGGATWRRATGTSNWTYTWVPGVLGTATLMSRASDDSGNLEQSAASVVVTVTQANCPCSIWQPSLTTPWMVDSNDGVNVEVGLKFSTDVGGIVNGLRFYKATTNTGTHVGHLWTGAGTLLSTVTFTGESASGWQTATFASPAIIQPNTTYVISYYAPNGHYSDDQYFLGRAAVDQWPLHALKSTPSEPNGVFNYGASGFPSQTWFSDSYGVDVIFTPDLLMPTVALTAPAAGANISGNAVTVSATATDNLSIAGVQFKIDGANLNAEDTASPYSIAWNSTLTANGSHTLTAVARDAAGNLTTSAPVTVSVFNADTVPPAVSITSPANSATVHGSVTVVAAASDNQGVSGVQFMVDGVLVGSELNAPPYSMTWDTSALANNSTHTLQARARDTSNNLTTSAANTVTVLNPVAGAPAIDAMVSTDQPNNQTTVTSPVFSTTSGNELLLAFISADYLGGTNTTVTGITGGGLTWALVGRTNVQAGSSEVWRAFAGSPLTNVSVVATMSQAVDSSMTVISFSNVDTSGTNGSGAIGATASANSIAAAPSATLTTTRNNSWVFGVGNDYDTATGRTVGANQTLLHQYFPPVGDTYWVQRQLNPTPASGTAVTINDTQPNGDRYNLFIVEIKALNAPDVTPPTVSMTAPSQGATVSGSSVTVSATASDNVAVTSVQFKLDGANLGAADTATPYSFTWDSKTATNGSHSLTAVASDGAGNTTTATAVTVTVDNDTTPPTVAITAPAAGASVSATVSVSANAADDKAVVGVQFKLDGANLGAELTAAPYTMSWNTTTIANGTHVLTAVARDAAANSTTSAPVSVTVNNVDATPPTVGMTAPANGATVAGTSVAVSAT